MHVNPHVCIRRIIHLSLAMTAFAAACSSSEFAESAERPNVLFLAIDDLNDWIGINGAGGHPQAITPNLDRLFSRSVYFSNAHCTAPVCAASRNSLLSGLRPSTTGWYTNTNRIRTTYDQILGDIPPLPLQFRQNGYTTLGGGKIYHKGVADFAEEQLWDTARAKIVWSDRLKDRGHGYGGMHFYPFPRDGGHVYQLFQEGVSGQSLCWGALDAGDMPDGLMPDEHLAHWAVEQLSHEFDQPFFLAVGFRRPHVPYTAPRRYFDLYDVNTIHVPEIPNDDLQDIPVYGKAMALGTLPGGDHKVVMQIGEQYARELAWAYLACVSFVDDQVGKVLGALENSPYADNTVIVVWSDHGQHLGEKKHWRKQCLWEESTRVPLAIHIPGASTNGQTCSRSVSLLDLYPTLNDICDLPPIEGLEGDSLMPLLDNPEDHWNRPAVTTWYYQNHSVRSERWRYIVYRDGSEELYDHSRDALEHRNLANDPQYAEIVEEHRKWLPSKNQLPAGMNEWEGDSLDKKVRQWEKSGGVPDWLQ